MSDAQARVLYGPNTPKGRKLIERADEVLAAIQRVCSELHLKYVGPTRLSPASVEFSSYSYRREGEIRTVVKFSTEDVRFEIIANDGTVVSYMNTAVDKQIEDGPYFEPPDQPKLGTQEAVELATYFLNLIRRDADIRLAPQSANFDHMDEMPTKTGIKTKQGDWWVRWQRLDEEGHPFAGDFANACFAEGYGPSSLSSPLDIPYHKNPAPIITQGVAEKAARGALADVRWAGQSFAAIHLESSVLCICRPEQDIYDSGAGAEARLAWSQTFGCELPGPSGGWISYYVAVDAHSAKVIGADSGTGIGEREK